MTKKRWLGFIAWMCLGLGLYYAGKKTAGYKNQLALQKLQ
jgi:hypothetical protein